MTAVADRDIATAARVGVIGVGSIGSTLLDLLSGGRVSGCVPAGAVTSRTDGPAALRGLAAGCDVLVECAGVDAVRECIATAGEVGCPLVVCSTGAFAEPELESWYRTVGRDRVVLPSGAVGGLDLLTALAHADPHLEVHLTTTKSPAALGVEVAGPTVVFTGSAREAIARFPKTANVGVTLGLATAGLDATTVVVIAEPGLVRTRHVVEATSTLGAYRFEIENATAGGSGSRTSALTAWSVVAAVETAATQRRQARRTREADL